MNSERSSEFYPIAHVVKESDRMGFFHLFVKNATFILRLILENAFEPKHLIISQERKDRENKRKCKECFHRYERIIMKETLGARATLKEQRNENEEE